MLYFSKDAPRLAFAAPSVQLAALGVALFLSGLGAQGLALALESIPPNLLDDPRALIEISSAFRNVGAALLASAFLTAVLALIICWKATDAQRMRIMVRRGLFDYSMGNPLHLKEGERLPSVRCRRTELGSYEIVVGIAASRVEDISNISSSISASLSSRFESFAVTQTDIDVAFNSVTFTVEDVTIDRSLYCDSVEDLRSGRPHILVVQRGASIDLSTSGSMLVAGKTRSGKTTGIIALLLQALLVGPDDHGSRVTIIDPKRAELSQLPHVVTLDADGVGRAALDALRDFADSVTERQAYLNTLARERGDAVKWWDAGLHVSLLFIDEYVSARTIFPPRASKDDPDYCLATFDNLVKRIVTMGASAGCYVIVSIAEASVESGGLPAMLRSAMSTKVLFRPTLPEARLMWDAEKVKDMPARTYGPGDAWFSSTDGIHDRVSFVHFPVMSFPVYGEMGRLLNLYYS